MKSANRALHLVCWKCGELTPHHAIPEAQVDDEESRKTARFLSQTGYFDNKPLKDEPWRTTFPRGRECLICGSKVLTVELAAETLERLLKVKQHMEEITPIIKQIEKTRRETSALLKKLKTG